jgi:hypothetical protein
MKNIKDFKCVDESHEQDKRIFNVELSSMMRPLIQKQAENNF